jgi:hypothetical protein
MASSITDEASRQHFVEEIHAERKAAAKEREPTLTRKPAPLENKLMPTWNAFLKSIKA